jgi:hypothetical protein
MFRPALSVIHRPAAALRACLLPCLLAGAPTQAFVVAITPGPKALFLQVGAGTMAGGNYNGLGTPGNNGTINRVSLTVPAANIGTGSRVMTTDSTVTDSPYNGFARCNKPTQVYVGGFYRTSGAPGNATLTVTTPLSLNNSLGGTMAFSAISWVSGGNQNPSPGIPSGTFAGGTTQTLASVGLNTYFEDCLQFFYANTQLLPYGAYTGQAVYTLTSP